MSGEGLVVLDEHGESLVTIARLCLLILPQGDIDEGAGTLAVRHAYCYH